MNEDEKRANDKLVADLRHELTSAIERAQSERHTAELAEKERDQLRAELAAMTRELQKLRDTPPVEITQDFLSPCGHNQYWKTCYGSCMACQRDEIDAIRLRVVDENDSLRAALAARVEVAP